LASLDCGFPWGFISGNISNYSLHLVLYLSLIRIADPYPELPERILAPFVIVATFIWTGNEIAPAYKNTTAIVLFGLWLFIAGGFIFLTWAETPLFGRILYFQAGGIGTVMAIVGAFFGLYRARKKNKDKG
jgi:hypothetical protein